MSIGLPALVAEACRLRGDPAGTAEAIVAELAHLSPTERTDLAAHFLAEIGLWRRVRGIEATTPSPAPQSRLAGPIPARRGPAPEFGRLAAAHASGLTKFSTTGRKAN